MDRRVFLKASALGTLTSARVTLGEHRVVSAAPLIVEFDLSTLGGVYTPVEDFYVRNHGPIPRDPGGILRIEGEVADPQTVRYDALASSPKRELAAVLECAGNPVRPSALVSNGVWEGWPLENILMRARPHPSATHLHLLGRDQYVRSVPLGRARGAAMLVTHLNGRPLRARQGAPWRALFPGWYGMDSVKWLQAIVVSGSALPSNDLAYVELTKLHSGSIEQRALPRIQVKSIICSPADGSVLHSGKTIIRGVAWSGEATVSTVEVSRDGGESWHPASVEPGTGYGWATWQLDLEVQRGAAEFLCRATDEKANKQVPMRDSARLDGYVNNWYHRIRCVIV